MSKREPNANGNSTTEAAEMRGGTSSDRPVYSIDAVI